ncbi:histone-like nucleoid-structuring protein Lsr2 [Nakamurella sp. A5-74]|uniref:Histone-like nucleoid-structuring protein Lsr2 n=1 Tax=Nakamurella sp. A5-74 TaxID=3158264 RepID=A0AAU8DLQ3_9ACTN
MPIRTRRPVDHAGWFRRHWGKKNGHSVSERGRIPEAILAAFDAAH